MIKTIFLDNTSKNLSLGSFNIILSPSLYWTKIFKIPVNSKKEALSVLPNIFDEYLNEGVYKYDIIKKENNEYLCFAYKEDVLLEVLQNANISLKDVNNVYFAQNEFEKLKEQNIFAVDSNKYMYQDDILVKIPSNMFKNIDVKNVDLSSIEFSKHTISINKSSKYIESKTAYILSSILIIFSLIVFAKAIVVSFVVDEFSVQKEKITKEYKLLPSMIQTKSVIKKYEKIQRKNLIIRNSIEYIVNFRRTIPGRLDKVEYKNGTVFAVYSNINFNNIKKYITQKYKKATIFQKNNKVEVRIKL